MFLLTIDGGGLRAFYSAAILMQIEEEFNIDLTKYFNLVGGTSAGSILAATIALGQKFSPAMRKLQKNIRTSIEARYPGLTGLTSLFAPSHSDRKINQMLDRCFGNSTLADCKTGLLVNTTDIVKGEQYVFCSPYHQSHVKQSHLKLKDVVRASMAAPTYFNPIFLDGRLLADGGLSSNSPSIITLSEAVGSLNSRMEDIRLLAIGTGIYSHYNRPEDKDSSWGILRWGKSLLYVTIQAHASIADFTLQRLLGDRYLRLELDLETYYEISDVNNIPLFIQWGKQTFKKNRDRLARFLGLERSSVSYESAANDSKAQLAVKAK